MLKNPFTFDESCFHFHEQQEDVLIWLTPNGDKLALYHFEIPPDIEAALDDNESLRAFYRANAHRAGLGVLEIETIVVDSLLGVRTLFKMAQRRHGPGRTYIGALTFPFRDFSYVFRVESPELGLTGTRETCVTAKLLSTQRMPEDFPSGWLDDPYDSNESGPMTRNISERPEYDSLFPDHPLSRARHVLDHLHRTITIDNSVKHLPKFTFDRNLPRHHRM